MLCFAVLCFYSSLCPDSHGFRAFQALNDIDGFIFQTELFPLTNVIDTLYMLFEYLS